ncbi:MAG: HAMP domain-containing protein [Myxococcaceae bacterium]|nr:HAMP domain-containing protein [Myxococcaceae bacterium]
MLLSLSLALLVTLGFLALLIPRQIESDLRGLVYNHAHSVAREIAALYPAGRLPATAQATPAPIPIGERDRVEWAAVLVEPTPGQPPVVVASRPRTLPDGFNRIRAQLDGASPSQRELPDGDALVVEPIDTGSSGPRAFVVVAARGVRHVMTNVRLTVLAISIAGFLLLAVISWALSRGIVLRPLKAMMLQASRLSEADLTGRVEVTRQDEIGLAAEALNRISQSLRETLGRIRGVGEGVAGVIEQISRTGNVVASGAATTQARVEETSSSMVQMLASLRGIAENVEVLYASAEESSSSIMQMAATNDEVAENVQAMAASVEETTSAIEQMTFSIKEVARNIEELLASTEETSSSMSEMDISIGQVEMNANETAKLSETVSSDAATGVEALQKTLAGIDKIKESSRLASSAIESLGKRIQEIGNILNVIDDVAEQTNLLALNAAIIAAQAGEHGKGFAVVAEEIKDLAERTGASTKEIADLIRSVQDESKNAVAVMNQGVKNVEEGVRLGREAETALKKIYDSANKSTMMVKAIARATVEQARGSKQVTSAIQRIAETVQQISKATNEQARGSEQIMKGAEKMKMLTSHVQRSAQEQAHGSRQIIKSIENINEMVTHLNRAQKEQTKGSEQVLKAVEAIKSVTEHQSKSVRQLEEAIDSLQKQAEVLKSEVRRFRV